MGSRKSERNDWDAEGGDSGEEGPDREALDRMTVEFLCQARTCVWGEGFGPGAVAEALRECAAQLEEDDAALWSPDSDLT